MELELGVAETVRLMEGCACWELQCYGLTFWRFVTLMGVIIKLMTTDITVERYKLDMINCMVALWRIKTVKPLMPIRRLL